MSNLPWKEATRVVPFVIIIFFPDLGASNFPWREAARHYFFSSPQLDVSDPVIMCGGRLLDLSFSTK